MTDSIARGAATRVASGNAAAIRLNNAGEIVSTPWEIQMMLEGRVFVAGTGIEEAGVAGIAALDEQTPVFGLVAPAGSVVIVPLWFKVHYDTEAAAAPANMHLAYVQADKAAYSAGTAMTAINALGGSNPRTAQGKLQHTLTALTAIVAAEYVALTSRLHILDNLQSVEMATTRDNVETMDRSPMELSWVPTFPIGLYKGASILFYAIDATARYNVAAAWVEVPADVYLP